MWQPSACLCRNNCSPLPWHPAHLWLVNSAAHTRHCHTQGTSTLQVVCSGCSKAAWRCGLRCLMPECCCVVCCAPDHCPSGPHLHLQQGVGYTQGAPHTAIQTRQAGNLCQHRGLNSCLRTFPLLHPLWQQAGHHCCAHADCSSNCDYSGAAADSCCRWGRTCHSAGTQKQQYDSRCNWLVAGARLLHNDALKTHVPAVQLGGGGCHKVCWRAWLVCEPIQMWVM